MFIFSHFPTASLAPPKFALNGSSIQSTCKRRPLKMVVRGTSFLSLSHIFLVLTESSIYHSCASLIKINYSLSLPKKPLFPFACLKATQFFARFERQDRSSIYNLIILGISTTAFFHHKTELNRIAGFKMPEPPIWKFDHNVTTNLRSAIENARINYEGGDNEANVTLKFYYGCEADAATTVAGRRFVGTWVAGGRPIATEAGGREWFIAVKEPVDLNGEIKVVAWGRGKKA
ncbi:hypothetical protein ACXHXM_36555|uniref:hypothetical protein n=1 Tax=Rhizobium mesoamericanum TaxID=1079800 RepID=UPI0012DF955E|nr:hypothetical protein [Rhizobium mesoamericanum]